MRTSKAATMFVTVALVVGLFPGAIADQGTLATEEVPAVDLDEGGASSIYIPPKAPVDLDLKAAPAAPSDQVTVLYSFETRDGPLVGTIEIRLPDGLSFTNVSTQSREIPVEGEEGRGSLSIQVDAPGAYAVRGELSAEVNGQSHEASGMTSFTIKEAGEFLHGRHDSGMFDKLVDYIPNGTPTPDGGSDTASAGCILHFTIQYITDSSVYKPNVPVEGLKVDVRTPSNSVVETTYTDSNGEAYFEVYLGDCTSSNREFNFYRKHVYADGSTKKIYGKDLSGTIYDGATSNRIVDDGDYFVQEVPAGESGSAYLHSQVTKAYKTTKGVGYTISNPVDVAWDDGQTPSTQCNGGDNCYDSSSGTIYIDGNGNDAYDEDLAFHEYGHHVHHDISTDTPSYNGGSHGHWWDSVHNTRGSAFLEGWAQFYNRFVEGTPVHGSYNLDYPSQGTSGGDNCRGPFRECSAGGVIWDAYNLSTTVFTDVTDVMAGNPQNIQRFYQEWVNQGKPATSSISSSMDRVHVATKGDADTWEDAGNSFSTSTSMANQDSWGDLTYSSNQEVIDRQDYYETSAGLGEVIDVSMTPPTGENFDLYLYDPDGNLRASSTASGDASESIYFTTDTFGAWRIEVSIYSDSQGEYSILLQ